MAAEFTPAADSGELLQHQAFVRRLARELVGRGARADDLVQDAWVAALERPPRVAAAARGWFRVVLRNLAGRHARENARRAAREEHGARSVVTADPAEVVERLAREQRLVQAVEALDEPYRTTVFLRYFEDLSPHAIATRQGVPLATVKTRLRRALAHLRANMESEGESRAWLMMLARISAPTSVLATKGVAVAGVLVLVASALFWLRGAAGGRGPALSAPQVAGAPGEDPRPTPAAGPLAQPEAPREVTRASLPAAPVEAEAPGGARTLPVAAPPEREEEATDAFVLRGRVSFPNGRGAPRASVALGPWKTTADAAGFFALEIERESLSGNRERGHENVRSDSALVAWLEGWAPAIEANVGRRLIAAARSRQTPTPVELVLQGASERLSGIVLDHAGSPARGWRVSLLDGTQVFSGRYRPFSAEDMVSGAAGHLETPDGRFEFDGLTSGRSYRVRAWNKNSLEQVTSDPLPAGAHSVVLQAPMKAWRAVVDGIVVGLDGAPLADVRCRLSMNEYQTRGGSWMTTGQELRTDASGRFEFHDVPPSELFIRFNGHNSGTSYALQPDDPGRGIRIEVVRSGSFTFETLSSPGARDAVRFIDDDGERLRIEVDVAPGSTRGTRELSLEQGAGTGRVSELARWVLLLRNGGELSRAPVVIRCGETLRIRL